MAPTEGFISRSICVDCTRLVGDFLADNTRHNENWMTLSSQYATLSVAKHLEGSTESLRRSAGAGCGLCKLIGQKLPQEPVDPAEKTYSIFVWEEAVPKTASKARLQITTHAVETFVRHVSDWREPPSLTIFGQRVDSFSAEELPMEIESSISIQPPCVSLMPASNLGSPENFDQARKWLHECRSTHPECLRTDAPLPTRIVHLEGSEEDIKISLSVTGEEHGRYAAVSYSWGKSDRIVSKQDRGALSSDAISRNGTYVIEQRNRRATEQGGYEYLRFWDPADIGLSAFPSTLKDAILIAHRLGYQYIWIDSLCIVQDSKSDWADQVARLTDIYSGADLVISAADSKTSTSGILNDIPHDRLQLGRWSMARDAYDIYVGDSVKVFDLERRYLSTRGWVFQERLVSSASLHYTSEGLVWECTFGTQISHHQGLSPKSWKREWNDIRQARSFHSHERPVVHPRQKTPHELWYSWISAYSARDLWKASDKFPAIAGIARTFAQAFRVTYFAGLWVEDFASGLTWARHNRTQTLVRYRDMYVAPSWSWGSVQGSLEHRNVQLSGSKDERKGPALKVLKYNVKDARKSKDGQGAYLAMQDNATIKVNALLQRITVDRHYQPGRRSRPFQHCGVSDGFLNNMDVVCTLDENDTTLPFDQVPQHYECWCLRVGSYRTGNIEADMFLLLDREEGEQEFHRVGFAETDPYLSEKPSRPHSGVFKHVREPITILIK